jgi:Transposase DDE domain
MNGPSLRRLKLYAAGRLKLKRYFAHPGDGRSQPRLSARALVWAILAGQFLRQTAFHAVEAIAHTARLRQSGMERCFGDDALGYFSERADPAPTRQALIDILHRAKRNKTFQESPSIGLAVDGTTVGRCREEGCRWCRPYRNEKKQIVGYRHHLAMISVVGAGVTLPFDVEPYGPKDSEYAAGQRLLRRAVPTLGSRFADYVVVDAGFATNTFLHTCDEVGLPVVARLKENLPELSGAVERRFSAQRPHRVLKDGKTRIEIWDADDFDPWETLRWQTVRVLRYRQHKQDGTVVQADWFTNLSKRKVVSLALYRMAKSRWEIENQGFNDCKTYQGLEHICHHHPNSLLLCWLLTLLAVLISRLYRLRYLHRGTHQVISACDLVRLLWLDLGGPASCPSG